MGEYLRGFSQVIEEGSLYPLHGFLVKSLILVLVVYSPEEVGVKSHLSKQSSIRI